VLQHTIIMVVYWGVEAKHHAVYTSSLYSGSWSAVLPRGRCPL
jgi:hypothetical protein